MRILIEINCDTIGQILTHLNEIKKEVSTEMKDQKMQMHKGRCEFPLDTYWDDCGAYGTHEFRIVGNPE